MKRSASPRQPLCAIRHEWRHAQPTSIAIWLAAITLLAPVSTLAAQQELGRLFYTPEQRAQLETARTQPAMQHGSKHTENTTGAPPATVRFDGMVIRSDGTTTRWVDGKSQIGTSSISGLKPGQIRANGKVYEPYQVLRPLPTDPAAPAETKSAP